MRVVPHPTRNPCQEEAPALQIAIITERDHVWALSAWERTIPKLRADGHEIVGLWTCPPALGKLRGNAIARWYLNAFGPADFAKLGAFAITAKLRRLIGRRPLSFRSLAKRNGIPFAECPSPNSDAFLSRIGDQKIDALLVTVSYILGESALAAPTRGTINKHAAALPHNRGLFPYFWATLNGTPQGVSYHVVTPGIDEGPLLVQDLSIPPGSLRTMVRFYLYVFRTFPDQIRAAVAALGRAETLPHNTTATPSYFGRPTREDVAAFRRKGGNIITINDIAGAWTL
jgi:hypothetical protein